MKTLNYQLLDDNLNLLACFKNQESLLNYCDTLPNMGRNYYIYNTVTKKSYQLI